MTLPPGVSEEAFAAAIAEFRTAVGAENVYVDPDDVALYRDAYSPLWDTPGERVASAAVAPVSAEEVSAIVKIANRYLIPIYAISTGKNLGYGGSAPNLSGSVVVDLKRMNKVLEVDDRRNFCVVEPGVSYFDLYDHVTKHGKKVIVDVPDPGWGSPVGNALDRGVGYMMPVYRDHWNAHCGLEAVMPDGEIVRTGMFAAPKAETYGEFRYGFGPMIDGLFSQGNAGIVTRMAFWMMPMPQHFFSGKVKVRRHADLVALVDGANYIEDLGLCGHVRFASPLALPANNIDPDLKALHDSYADAAAFQAYADRKGVEFYNITLNFYGSRELCLAHWDFARKQFSSIEGVTFETVNDYPFPISPENQKKIQHLVAVGIPNLSIFARGIRSDLMPTPSDGHIWFSPLVPRSGAAVIKAQEVFQQVFKEAGLPSPISPASVPATWIYRSFLMILAMYISRSDPDHNAKIVETFRKLVVVGAEHGWYEYRTGPVFQDQIANTYDWNSGALMQVQNTIKDAIDPNGIVSPGRGGIWPARLRAGK